jgi:CPA1 family monovalent cation:H+ antiporter
LSLAGRYLFNILFGLLMELITLINLLIVLTAAFAYINTRFLRLPDTIGLMIVSLGFSLLVIIGNYFQPSWFEAARIAINQIDYTTVVLDVMLSGLLFAGAFHSDSRALRQAWASIALFAVVGVILSTVLIGGFLYGLLQLIGVSTSFLTCLLFGALISPTDPIAVLGVLTRANVPKTVEIKIVGESLFNDGIGVVLFLILLEIIKRGPESVGVTDVTILFAQEALGGIGFGVLLGLALYYLLRSVDHYQTEILITLAAVLGGYSLANSLHVSGPLAMVVTGLFTGERAKQVAMSEITEEYVGKFWEIIDIILNAILFVLIGFRLVTLSLDILYLYVGLVTIFITLVSRYLSLRIPLFLSRRWLYSKREDTLMMTWGGLRGGLSIAMALSVPDLVPAKDLFITITYITVLFSIVGQGLSLEKVARRLYRNNR